jgi:hypothetical protein
MKTSTSDVDPDFSTKSNRLPTEMARMIIHSWERIFVVKSIDVLHIAKIGKGRITLSQILFNGL